MSLGDPLVSDEQLAEIRHHLAEGCSHGDDDFQWDCGRFERWCELLLPEVDRLREHNAYLTQMFYGIATLKVCERHNAVPVESDARHERVINAWCQDCRADDLRALAAGNVEMTTLAERYRACSDRALSLQIENYRLKQRLGEVE